MTPFLLALRLNGEGTLYLREQIDSLDMKKKTLGPANVRQLSAENYILCILYNVYYPQVKMEADISDAVCVRPHSISVEFHLCNSPTSIILRISPENNVRWL